MEAIELVVRLLEKVSVLVAAVLMLVLIRPAGVWLGETGAQASVRRRLLLVGVLGALAVWGTFLGFDVGGLQFNVRMVGIIVAGYLGGIWVGLAVGAAAGLVYGLSVTPGMEVWVITASVSVGLLAGVWSRYLGTSIASVAVGAVAIQALYHAAIGSVMAAIDLEMALSLASNVALHGAKITANGVGVLLFMGVLNLVRELERVRELAIESHAEARSARLEALQYQVRPHFLFNLLNTLAYLIRTNPDKARELTVELAEFLRYTLSRQDEETTLRDELRQIARYVELERARFGDGLQFAVDADDDLASTVVVPPLILQPLVENSIRHGAQGGAVNVRIEVVRTPKNVTIRVLDDGPGPVEGATTSKTGGVGLSNVRERLERFYHGSVELSLAPHEGGGACAEFAIPVDFAERRRSLADEARRRIAEVVA